MGGPGGSDQPSALNVRSIVTGLPAERLTNPITGSTINTAKAETATTIAIFFKGVSLLTNRVRRDSFSWPKCWKMFRMRNTGSMRTLTQLQQTRRVIQDFTLTALAGIPGLFARLAYLASLRDLSSGRYEHAGLAALYPDAAIQQALQLCHEQLFERILETPLSSQQEDLRACLPGMEGGWAGAASHWPRTAPYPVLLPEAAPDYL